MKLNRIRYNPAQYAIQACTADNPTNWHTLVHFNDEKSARAELATIHARMIPGTGYVRLLAPGSACLELLGQAPTKHQLAEMRAAHKPKR